MPRPVASASVLAALLALAAGCLDVGGPATVHPADAGTPWTTPADWTGARAAMSSGCGGPCAGTSATGPEFEWTGIDAAGRVLHVRYALGSEPGVVANGTGLGPWSTVLHAIFSGGGEYGQQGGPGVRVFTVEGRHLSGQEAAKVDAVLDHAGRRLEPLGPPVYDCDDCGAPVLHAKGLAVQLRGNADRDSGWTDVQDQMQALAAWMRPPR